MVYTANWVIIWYLPPIKGTRNSYWKKQLAQTMGFLFDRRPFPWEFPENQIWMWTKKGSEISGKRWTDSINQFRSTYFDQQQKIHPKHSDFFSDPNPFCWELKLLKSWHETICMKQLLTWVCVDLDWLQNYKILQSTSANNFLSQKNIANQKNCLWQN